MEYFCFSIHYGVGHTIRNDWAFAELFDDLFMWNSQLVNFYCFIVVLEKIELD